MNDLEAMDDLESRDDQDAGAGMTLILSRPVTHKGHGGNKKITHYVLKRGIIFVL